MAYSLSDKILNRLTDLGVTGATITSDGIVSLSTPEGYKQIRLVGVVTEKKLAEIAKLQNG